MVSRAVESANVNADIDPASCPPVDIILILGC